MVSATNRARVQVVVDVDLSGSHFLNANTTRVPPLAGHTISSDMKRQGPLSPRSLAVLSSSLILCLLAAGIVQRRQDWWERTVASREERLLAPFVTPPSNRQKELSVTWRQVPPVVQRYMNRVRRKDADVIPADKAEQMHPLLLPPLPRMRGLRPCRSFRRGTFFSKTTTGSRTTLPKCSHPSALFGSLACQRWNWRQGAATRPSMQRTILSPCWLDG